MNNIILGMRIIFYLWGISHLIISIFNYKEIPHLLRYKWYYSWPYDYYFAFINFNHKAIYIEIGVNPQWILSYLSLFIGFQEPSCTNKKEKEIMTNMCEFYYEQKWITIRLEDDLGSLCN